MALTKQTRKRLDAIAKRIEDEGHQFMGFVVCTAEGDESLEAVTTGNVSHEDFAGNILACLHEMYPDIIMDEADAETKIIHEA